MERVEAVYFEHVEALGRQNDRLIYDYRIMRLNRDQWREKYEKWQTLEARYRADLRGAKGQVEMVLFFAVCAIVPMGLWILREWLR